MPINTRTKRSEYSLSIYKWARGLSGILVGCLLGYVIFFWLVRRGYFFIALPGAFVGISCAMALRLRSPTWGAISAIAAVNLSILIEWRFAPFQVDGSYAFFLAHVHELDWRTIGGILISGAIAFVLGSGWGSTHRYTK